ncbi:hypothetical protein DFH09DRAFT_1437237 [Mycena vulgaris]|nr:hypothetical protein DFH09DRAFT_1437237 [Mycena vulgaris]
MDSDFAVGKGISMGGLRWKKVRCKERRTSLSVGRDVTTSKLQHIVIKSRRSGAVAWEPSQDLSWPCRKAHNLQALVVAVGAAREGLLAEDLREEGEGKFTMAVTRRALQVETVVVARLAHELEHIGGISGATRRGGGPRRRGGSGRNRVDGLVTRSLTRAFTGRNEKKSGCASRGGCRRLENAHNVGGTGAAARGDKRKM